jgi:hypothetical protein
LGKSVGNSLFIVTRVFVSKDISCNHLICVNTVKTLNHVMSIYLLLHDHVDYRDCRWKWRLCQNGPCPIHNRSSCPVVRTPLYPKRFWSSSEIQ